MKPNAVLDSLVAAIAQRMKESGQGGTTGPYYRATPSAPQGPMYTGPASLFGVAGLERDIISSRIMPMGLADRLPVVTTNMMTPLFPYFNGFGADVGNEPNGPCDDPPVAGAGATCLQTAQFGRFSRATRTLDLTRLGEQMNRGEFMDLRFLNGPLLGGQAGLTTPSNIPGQVNPRQETAMRMIELGASFQNWFTRKIYDANPANNTAGGGYREFPGLDILIGTTKVDALTQAACPALASDIKDLNYKRVDTNGVDYVTMLSYMMRFLRYNAQHMNFGAVNWVIVMRPELFWELTAVWPCIYMTWRCQTSAGNEAFVDAADMVNMRDDMRNGEYLLIDGIRYDVILDNNIQEDTNTNNNKVASGCMSSDIYVIPLTVRGGMPVIYWETFDYRTSMNIMGEGPLASQYFWSDDGRYLWHFKPPTNWCVQWEAIIEPRIILRTPQLAGRLTNALYCPLQHPNDVRASDPYFRGTFDTNTRNMQARYGDWGLVNQS